MVALNIAIVDDDEVDRTLLSTLIQKSAKTLDISITLNIFSDGNEFLASAASIKYSIVFMDIFMKDKNGIETAKNYRTLDLQSFIVFLTSSPEHRQGAFSVHAFDYIEKPVKEASIMRVLNDIKLINPTEQPSLSLTAHKQTYKFLYSDIQYLASDLNYIKIYTKQELRFRTNFSNVQEELLKDSRFFLLNRGIIINLDWVESIDMENFICLMKSKITFPIAKRKMANFKNLLKERHFSN